jgi:hypothetical protein
VVTIRNGGVNQQRSFTHNLIIQKIKKEQGYLDWLHVYPILSPCQVSSMSSPIMAQQDATALPEELGRLRQDVASLRQDGAAPG